MNFLVRMHVRPAWQVQSLTSYEGKCKTREGFLFREFRFSWSPGVLYGEAPVRGPTTFPLYTIFDRKGTPFVYLLLKNGTPFTRLVYSFAFPLTAVHSLSLKYEQITKPERFLDLFTTIECISQLYWVFLQTTMTDFPILSYTSISEITTLSYT